MAMMPATVNTVCNMPRDEYNTWNRYVSKLWLINKLPADMPVAANSPITMIFLSLLLSTKRGLTSRIMENATKWKRTAHNSATTSASPSVNEFGIARCMVPKHVRHTIMEGSNQASPEPQRSSSTPGS